MQAVAGQDLSGKHRHVTLETRRMSVRVIRTVVICFSNMLGRKYSLGCIPLSLNLVVFHKGIQCALGGMVSLSLNCPIVPSVLWIISTALLSNTCDSSSWRIPRILHFSSLIRSGLPFFFFFNSLPFFLSPWQLYPLFLFALYLCLCTSGCV